MNGQVKNWSWFLVIMGMILGIGIYLGSSRRAELGGSFNYSLDEYRTVDEALIRYRETEPLAITLEDPSALALDAAGNTYVAGRGSIAVYPAQRLIPVEGSPTCLAVDASGTVYAGFTNRIDILPREGEQSSIEVPSDKAYLTSLAVDARYVYAADAGSRKIWRFSLDGGEPFEIGHEDGAGARGFYVPSPFFDIALVGDGSLWAVNPGYHALEHYGADGTYLSGWEKSSMTIEGFSGCCNPSHIALLPDGAFVTAEKGLPRVKIHESDGTLRCVVAAPDQFDEEVTGLDLAVDSRGCILVLDADRKQVRIFEEKP